MINLLKQRRTRGQRGFTAIEIAMVATVIAILALLVLPLFRKRTEEARIAAVQDELQSIVKATLLVEADLDGFQPRLQDMDNVQNTASTLPVGAGDVSTAPPIAEWNRTLGFSFGGPSLAPAPIADNRQTKVVPNWAGAYLAVRKAGAVADIQLLVPNAIYPFGPVYVVGANASSPAYDNGGSPIADDAADRYPLDPWGNPYLLFGRGRMSPESESTFNSRVVYSMGPDGLPGASSPIPIYLRKGDRFSGATPAGVAPTDRGVLGTGDDYEFVF